MKKSFSATREWLRKKGYKPGDGKGGIVPVASIDLDEKTPAPIRLPLPKKPNGTEARWLRDHCLQWGDAAFRYETWSVRLPSGTWYTPDWTVWSGALLIACVEVKGPKEFASHARAVHAFKEAIAAYPDITWIWSQWKDETWNTTCSNYD